MKKIALLLLLAILFSVTACKKTPDTSESSNSENSSNLKLTDSMDCKNSSVKFSHDGSYSYKAEYNVTPATLDLRTLAKEGYYVKIEATFDVYYEKDFDVPFDIGYLGAPDHDVQLVDAYEQGTIKENLITNTEATPGSITLIESAQNLVGKNIYLKLITYNLQNIVYFENIKVTYTCQKSAT